MAGTKPKSFICEPNALPSVLSFRAPNQPCFCLAFAVAKVFHSILGYDGLPVYLETYFKE